MLAQSFLALALGAAAVSASPLSQRASNTLANGAVSQGCYRDTAGDGLQRTFGDAAFNDASMTNELCATSCNDKGYAWSGTQYYDQCFCSNDAPTISSSDCTTPCRGDSSETCGGSWALTTYKNDQIANVDNFASVEYSRVGCLTDSPDNRALVGGYYTFYNTNYPSLEYFGVTYSFECFCGTEPSNPTSNKCTKACPGNSKENCGGTGGINTFKVINPLNNPANALATVPPTDNSDLNLGDIITVGELVDN